MKNIFLRKSLIVKKGYGNPISHWIETKLIEEIIGKFDSSNLVEDEILFIISIKNQVPP